ncbi:hypothetical protein M407DRAFT_23222 [Tulasnella calospora MUT 4182]|uniref:MalT-like TPR region domain-containing protein n=1 Tax=Tulasnella calospora MUT 4182 TaxID=1051891 RepID=A0A0C3M1E8_9AGAM|nr:hypothetical protein M407DRAFT_23222 [Tulasnella calospora MUT 4182]
MTDCWALNPRDRPSISWCCDEVKWMASLPPLGGVPSDSKVGAGRLLLQMGRMHYQRGRYGDAASLFQQVLQGATSKKDRKESAEASYWLGNISASQGKYTEVEEFYTRAQDTYWDIFDDLGRANVLRVEAEEFFRQAHIIYAYIGNDMGRYNALVGRGDVNCARSRHAQAESLYTRSLEISTRIDYVQGQANAKYRLAEVYCRQSQHTMADPFYKEAREIYARIGVQIVFPRISYSARNPRITLSQGVFGRVRDQPVRTQPEDFTC